MASVIKPQYKFKTVEKEKSVAENGYKDIVICDEDLEWADYELLENGHKKSKLSENGNIDAIYNGLAEELEPPENPSRVIDIPYSSRLGKILHDELFRIDAEEIDAPQLNGHKF